MEAIATGLAVEAVKAITKVVAGSAFEEMKLVWGFKRQLKELKERFQYIEALMEDLANRKHAEKSTLVNVWLQGVKEVACSAENLLDDHEYEMLRRKIELKINDRPSFKKKCRNHMSASTSPIVFRVRMTHRVKQILSKFDELDKKAMKIGLKPVKLAEKAVSGASTSASHTHLLDSLYQARKHAAARGSEFIGREKDEQKLLQMLLNPSAQEADLSILAIVGIGGLGKTTLARELYEHKEVNGYFDGKKAWICVSEYFSVDKLLREMVESLTSTKCDLINTGAIIKKLEEALMGHKFFLVLDDVWNDSKELWDSLKTELQKIGGLTGSVILITTRSSGVAKEASASYSHKLPGLSEKDGWDLLKRQVFDETMAFHFSFHDIGIRIVKKCQGVPLAIKAIGRLLKSKTHAFEWESIERSELWDIQPNDNNYIMPSLLLSYNHLDHVYIKRCFAYCAIYPKDSIMEKGQLIALWLAQGLLHDDESKTNNSYATLETIGENYINFLVNNSFLEEEDEGYKTRYKMHDLVHDLATYVSKKDFLVWKAGVKLEDVDSHLLHLAFSLGENEIELETHTEKKILRKLRTMSFWDSVPRWNPLIFARYVRTLVMVEVGLKEVPYVIGQLVHLRYLDLSDNYKIKSLPDSICKLYQLQTLRLLHCFGLEKLPRELHRLEKLRHIETSTVMMASKGLGKLSSIQTLPDLKLRDGKGWTIDELGPLDQVKDDLCIYGLESVKNKEEAREAGLWRKDKISKLEMSWSLFNRGNSNNHEDVLDGLEPHPNIRSLCIDGFKGVRFPGWITTMSVTQRGHPTQLSHLTELKISGCTSCQQLPSFGQLPHLTILSLKGFDAVKCIGDEFFEKSRNISDVATEHPVGVGGVTERIALSSSPLRELSISYFKTLTTWMPSSSALTISAFPNLETLEIEYCEQLETIPVLHLESLKHLSLNYLGGIQPLDIIKGSPGLSSLQVSGVTGMVSLPQELSNCRNLQKLMIRSFENVKFIPSGMISLKELKIIRCLSLVSIPNVVLQRLTSLRQLTIDECLGLKRIPTSLEDCISLEDLGIKDCPVIEEPVPDIGKLRGLMRLELVNAGRMMAYSPRWIPHLHRLSWLKIGGWGEEWDMSVTSTLTSLKFLVLEKLSNLKPLPQPHEHLLPPLQILSIDNIEEMETLPEWIGYLSSLQKLYLQNCNKLKYLPSETAMLRLSLLLELFISECPVLKERCDKNDGPEWTKISRIPSIIIDFDEVQDFE